MNTGIKDGKSATMSTPMTEDSNKGEEELFAQYRGFLLFKKKEMENRFCKEFYGHSKQIMWLINYVVSIFLLSSAMVFSLYNWDKHTTFQKISNVLSLVSIILMILVTILICIPCFYKRKLLVELVVFGEGRYGFGILLILRFFWSYNKTFFPVTCILLQFLDLLWIRRRLVIVYLTSVTNVVLYTIGFPVGLIAFGRINSVNDLLASIAEYLSFVVAQVVFCGIFYRICGVIRQRFIKAQQLVYRNRQVRKELMMTNKLLRNIIPETFLSRIQQDRKLGVSSCIIRQTKEDSCILQSDLVEFTKWSSGLRALFVVRILNAQFSHFDNLCKSLNVEKCKTVGDAFIATTAFSGFCGDEDYYENDEGVIIPNDVDAIILLGLGMIVSVQSINDEYCGEITDGLDEEDRKFRYGGGSESDEVEYIPPLKGIRIGIALGRFTGVVVSNNDGNFLRFDCYGETFERAVKMEETAQHNSVNVDEEVFQRTKDSFNFTNEGKKHLLLSKLTICPEKSEESSEEEEEEHIEANIGKLIELDEYRMFLTECLKENEGCGASIKESSRSSLMDEEDSLSSIFSAKGSSVGSLSGSLSGDERRSNVSRLPPKRKKKNITAYRKKPKKSGAKKKNNYETSNENENEAKEKKSERSVDTQQREEEVKVDLEMFGKKSKTKKCWNTWCVTEGGLIVPLLFLFDLREEIRCTVERFSRVQVLYINTFFLVVNVLVYLNFVLIETFRNFLVDEHDYGFEHVLFLILYFSMGIHFACFCLLCPYVVISLVVGCVRRMRERKKADKRTRAIFALQNLRDIKKDLSERKNKRKFCLTACQSVAYTVYFVYFIVSSVLYRILLWCCVLYLPDHIRPSFFLMLFGFTSVFQVLEDSGIPFGVKYLFLGFDFLILLHQAESLGEANIVQHLAPVLVGALALMSKEYDYKKKFNDEKLLLFSSIRFVKEKTKNEKLIFSVIPEIYWSEFERRSYSSFSMSLYCYCCFLKICSLKVENKGEVTNNIAIVRKICHLFSSFDDIIRKGGKCNGIKTIQNVYMFISNDVKERSEYEIITQELTSVLRKCFDLFVEERKKDEEEIIEVMDLENENMTKQQQESEEEELKITSKKSKKKSEDCHNHISLKLQCGVALGELGGGIIGRDKFIFDVFGDTCNFASRLASVSKDCVVTVANKNIHLQKFCRHSKGNLSKKEFDKVELKGKGSIRVTYLS